MKLLLAVILTKIVPFILSVLIMLGIFKLTKKINNTLIRVCMASGIGLVAYILLDTILISI